MSSMRIISPMMPQLIPTSGNSKHFKSSDNSKISSRNQKILVRCLGSLEFHEFQNPERCTNSKKSGEMFWNFAIPTIPKVWGDVSTFYVRL